MTTSSDLWEKLGEIEPEEYPLIVSQLFATYEEILERDPKNKEAQAFFENLDRAVGQATTCNANRR